MTAREAAKIVGIDERTLRMAIKSGRVPAKRAKRGNGHYWDVELDDAWNAVKRRRPKSLIARIGEHFEFSPDGCWRWTGSVTPQGYGMFAFSDEGKRAHRVMYELLVGPIPEGLTLDHLCRVRHCVNPEHLEPVTLAENVRRGWRSRGGRLRLVSAEGSP